MEEYMLIIWIAATVLLVVVEAITVQLVTIWFAAGTLAALIANLAHAPMWLQWTIFITVSIIALVATRPLVKKISSKKVQPTNADRCIGQTAVVLEDIDNEHAQGMVSVGGVKWTARSTKGEYIGKDESVTVDKIEGVKLLVTKH